jgi:hypothetical protein
MASIVSPVPTIVLSPRIARTTRAITHTRHTVLPGSMARRVRLPYMLRTMNTSPTHTHDAHAPAQRAKVVQQAPDVGFAEERRCARRRDREVL